ncbi:MAG: hypothetical protein K2X43_21150 [Hyphomonadaceae bacterium]|nr:hypothetical protein [Hyphomonadaceae bacterium]
MPRVILTGSIRQHAGGLGAVDVAGETVGADGGAPLGLDFGATSGEVFGSGDGGRSWSTITPRLPPAHSVRSA